MEPEVVTLQSFPPLLYNSHLFLLLPYCLYFQSCRKEKEKQKGWIWIIATKLDWLKGSGLGWHWELWNTGLRTISIQKIYWEATGLYIPCSSWHRSKTYLIGPIFLRPVFNKGTWVNCIFPLYLILLYNNIYLKHRRGTYVKQKSLED